MADTIWTANAPDKLYLMSGEFTSIIKTSQGIIAFPSDISYDGNTLWSSASINKLYLQSGLFTSIIKDSIPTVSTDNITSGISSGHGNTPWLGREHKKMFLYSGQFTSIIKTSQNIPVEITTPSDMAYDADKYAENTSLTDVNFNKLFLLSGQFTSIIKDSQSINTIDISLSGITFNGTNTPWIGYEASKLYLQSGQFTSILKTSQYIGGINLYPRGIETSDYEGRTGIAPSPPTGVGVVAGVEKNTISWITDPDSVTDNIYWTTEILPNDDFSDIDDWTLEIKNGTGSITNPSGVIRLDIPDSGSNNIRALNDNTIPSDDFEIIVDITGYSPDDTTNGVKAEIRLRDSLSENDYINIYVRQSGVSSYAVRAGYSIDSVFTWFDSEANIGSNIVDKFRARRIGTVLYIDYFVNNLWTTFGSYDFSTRASYIDEFTFGCINQATRGGYVEFDNFEWKLKANGTKIAGVTSPRDHTSLTPGQMYYYVVTGENYSGESDESTMVNEQPLPDKPENVIATPGLIKNTLSWDSVSGADKYNIYWLNTSPVTKITGNKLADKTSPYVHEPLTGDLPYYYVITAEANGIEGGESDEVTATPYPTIPTAPINFRYIEDLSGDSQIALAWDAAGGIDSYNLYFIKRSELDALVGVKTTSVDAITVKQYGTKISCIVDTQCIHYPLSKDDYYYVLVGVNAYGEGYSSNVVLAEVMFEGKIFDHNSEALNQLAYQYQGE